MIKNCNDITNFYKSSAYREENYVKAGKRDSLVVIHGARQRDDPSVTWPVIPVSASMFEQFLLVG